MTQTKERIDQGTGTGIGAPWLVIVLNDNHNTFEGVAASLGTVIGISFDQGMAYANKIHTRGQATVWSGHREVAEHYWNGLKQRGLTMAPLES